MIPPINIDLESLNFISIVPMLVAIFGALTILCIDLFTKKLDKSFYIMIAILCLVIGRWRKQFTLLPFTARHIAAIVIGVCPKEEILRHSTETYPYNFVQDGSWPLRYTFRL